MMDSWGSFINRLRESTISRRLRRSPHVTAPDPPLNHENFNLDKAEKQYATWRPSSLPPRVNHLTPNSSSTYLQIPCNPQNRSQLFQLPAELRAQIWADVVGNQIAHILLQGPGLSHVECYNPDKPDWWRHDCLVQSWDVTIPYIGKSRKGTASDGGKLDVLMTCRRVYWEAIDFLYSTNTFDINNGDRLLDFATSILPQRLTLVENLHLRHFHSSQHNGDPSFASWLEVVSILKRMQGLKSLRLELSTEKSGLLALSMSPSPIEDENKLFSPLMGIQHVKDFVVEVNWAEGTNSVSSAESPWPFELRRLTHR